MRHDAIAEYAIKKLGGEKAILRELAKEQIANALADNATIGQLIEMAKEGDFVNMVLSMPVKSLGGVQGSGGSSKASSVRITKEQKEAMRAGIVGFLRANPWRKKSEIAGHVGYGGAKVAVQMRFLKAEGQIKSSGQKAGTVWALQGEESEAPK